MGKIIASDVATRIQSLGARIRVARKRRGFTIAETAAKAGVNRNTLNALEQGKPGVEIGAYVTVLWLFGLDRSLEQVANPDNDTHGKTLETSRRPKRVRKPHPSKNEYDF